MPTERFVVPLAGRVEIAVRDLEDGWTERFAVESERDLPEVRVEMETGAPPDAAYFAERVGAAAKTSGTTLERAAALRSWACGETVGRVGAETGPEMRDRRRERRARPPLMDDDARAVLADVDGGGGANCATAAIVMLDAARALGLEARRCELHVRGDEALEAHSTVEVWAVEEGRWVVMDPTFDCSYEIDGRPAGALDIHEAVRRGAMRSVRVIRAEASKGLDPFTYVVNPLLYYRHISIRLGGGAYLDRVDEDTAPPSPSRIDLVPTQSEASFRDRTPAPSDLVVRREVRTNRMGMVAIGGALEVAVWPGLFEPGRFEVRIEGATPRFRDVRTEIDPTDSTVVSREDLSIASPFPDGWTIEGAPRVEKSAEGVVVESDAPGTLELALDVAPRTPLMAFAWIRTERGKVTFVVATRDERDAMAVAPGERLPLGSRIVMARQGRTTLRVEIEAGARCIVERVEMHRALTLADVKNQGP